jgi:hypothetical protein
MTTPTPKKMSESLTQTMGAAPEDALSEDDAIASMQDAYDEPAEALNAKE